MNLLENPLDRTSGTTTHPVYYKQCVAEGNIVNATLMAHPVHTDFVWVVRYAGMLGSTPVLIAGLHSRLHDVEYSQINGDTWPQPTPQICLQFLCNAQLHKSTH